ncbi:MAG: hypothetical protein HYX75_25650 [Acidobacteria bacterium]|nr:hypothetical protein [Acidobacteriota bacterium]
MFWVALGHACVALAEQLPVRVYTVADGLSQDAISDIEWDPSGFLWFCTTDGLSRFDGYEFTIYGRGDGLTGNLVTDLVITRSGQYWVAASPGGLFRIDVAAALAGGVGLVGARDPAGSSARPFFVASGASELPSIYRLFETCAGATLCGSNRGLFRLEREGEL